MTEHGPPEDTGDAITTPAEAAQELETTKQELLDSIAPADVAQVLETAKEAFQAAWRSYDAAGVPLEQEVIKQLAPYHDQAYDRARVIRAFSRDLSEQIQSFCGTRNRQLSQVARLTLTFVDTTVVLAAEVKRAGIDALVSKSAQGQDTMAQVKALHAEMLAILAGLNPSQPPGETGGTEARAVELAQQRLATLADTIDRVGEEMIWAYWIATNVMELRQGELDAYLHKVPLVDRTSKVRKALFFAITKQAALTAIEFAPGAQIVGAVMSIIDARNEVREKVDAMTAHYERGALDEMFELAQAIDDEQQIHTALEKMLDRVDAFLRQVQSEFSAMEGLK